MGVLFFVIWIFSAQLIASPQDIDLEIGLRCVFSTDFGYTLIGSKPVSLEQGLDCYLEEEVEKRERLFNFLKKTFANSERFIFKTLKKHGYIELINKKALSIQIRKYKKLNDFVKKTYVSCDAFLKALESDDLDIFDAVEHDSVLIAIALGYGEENGNFFVRRCDVGEYLQKFPIVAFFPFDQRPSPFWAIPRNTRYFRKPNLLPKPSLLPLFESLEKEWQWIKSVSREFNRESYLEAPYYISLPGYISRYGSESDMIHDKFLKSKETLARMFCGRKFSEVITKEAAKK